MSQDEDEMLDDSEDLAFYDEDMLDAEVCAHCGKDLEEFGDMGCEYCDCRHPGFGVQP